jgi:hypothetical protein
MSQELKLEAGDTYAQRIFLAWHAFEGIKLVVRMLMRGRIVQPMQFFMQLCWRNPLWPLRLVHGLLLRHAVMALD